jgi:hypothetical protein
LVSVFVYCLTEYLICCFGKCRMFALYSCYFYLFPVKFEVNLQEGHKTDLSPAYTVHDYRWFCYMTGCMCSLYLTINILLICPLYFFLGGGDNFDMIMSICYYS